MRGTSAFKYIRRRRFARTKPNGSARRLASIELSLPGKLFDGKGNLEIRQATLNERSRAVESPDRV